MRVFFGLETPPDTALSISAWRDSQLPVLGRPVAVDNFHITLAFLGEADGRTLERLCLSVDAWPAAAAGTLALDQVGYWPRPGIYWLGPTRWPPALDNLALRLRGLGRQGAGKRDRDRFRPHITLFRRCQQPPPAPTLPPRFQFDYDRLVLFESRQGRRGVSYSPLAQWSLPVNP
jgi:2'-5' RNA ligase